MSAVYTLLKYKLLYFFGPSFRGKWGPAPLIMLELLFSLYGLGAGFGIGTLLKDSSTGTAIGVLGSVLSGLLSIGFLYSLGSGFTASPSELDFVMTTQLRPREFLISDMVFQFLSIGISGGLAGLLALIGIVVSMGRSLLILPLLLVVLLIYVFMVLMIVQILVVLRIKYPQASMRVWTVLLLLLSLLPAVSLAAPAFPLSFHGLPVPPSSYADILNAILVGQTPPLLSLVYSAAYPVAIAVVWTVLSTSYIFHGVTPTLSAGFGQINLSARQAQQRRLIKGLEVFTTRFVLRPDSGSDLGFMTRFHMIRILRDGSILFVILLVGITAVPNFLQSGSAAQGAGAATGLSQIMTIPIAILALNWGYYESTNLWLVASAGRSLVSYFRGLMLGLAAMVTIIALIVTALLFLATGKRPGVLDITFPIVCPLAASLVSTALLTRLKIKPGAFSPVILAIILVTVIAGIALGLVAAYFVAAVGSSSTITGIALQSSALVGFTVLLAAFGLCAVGELAKGYIVHD